MCGWVGAFCLFVCLFTSVLVLYTFKRRNSSVNEIAIYVCVCRVGLLVFCLCVSVFLGFFFCLFTSVFFVFYKFQKAKIFSEKDAYFLCL